MPHDGATPGKVPPFNPHHRIETHLSFTPSLRRHIVSLIFTAIWILFLIIIVLIIPSEGYIFFEMEISEAVIPIGISKFWTGIIIFLIIIYSILSEAIALIRTLNYRIELSPKYLEFRYGILHKNVESIDLHIVTDFFKKRSPIDQLLRLSNIKILSKDIRTPEIFFNGLDVDDAEDMLKYLQTYASNSLVEYFVSKEHRGSGRGIPGAGGRPSGGSARVRP